MKKVKLENKVKCYLIKNMYCVEMRIGRKCLRISKSYIIVVGFLMFFYFLKSFYNFVVRISFNNI